MKLLISRGNYARVTAGMSPVERDQFDQLVELCPDGETPQFRVDQDRVGARCEELLREEHDRRAREDTFYACVRRGGCEHGHGAATVTVVDTRWTMPDPWDQIGPGVWWAPAGTPPPEVQPFRSGPAPDMVEVGRWLDELPPVEIPYGLEHRRLWAYVDELIEQDLEERRRQEERFRLNNVIQDDGPTAAGPQPTPAGPVEDLRTWMRRYETTRFRPRRLEAGETALAALTAAADPPPRDWANDLAGTLADIPIVPNEDLPANAWRMIDTDTGQVLNEGTVAADLATYVHVSREAVNAIADEAGVPRDLLW